MKLEGNTSTKFTFFDDVYDVVRLIPKGKITTYGAIATYLGCKLSARMVGWAMNAGHNLVPKIPAHRVVNRIGELTGKYHFGINEEMKKLLESEGHQIVDNKIINFKISFWNPSEELKIN